jgi:Toprim-like
MSLIADTLLTHLPGKRKTTPSGWISFNAPCCGDRRQRGGFIINSGAAVSYHCFNCGFKASWQPGRTLSQKMRKFMKLLNMNDDTINKLGLEALRLNESAASEVRSIVPKFDERSLPEDAQPITSFEKIPEKLVDVLEYIARRNLYLEDYNLYWTPKIGFSNRVIIPFYFHDEIVGYTARAISDVKPKYISEQQPGYVFNLDNQNNDRDFTIVCEGPFDAISIDACAILGAEIKDSQNWLLKQLGKEIVLVPDRDHEGPRTVEQALEYGWSVSMPDWPEGIKDVNDAVVKLGRLATLWLIVSAKESNALKIRLKAKTWFKENV